MTTGFAKKKNVLGSSKTKKLRIFEAEQFYLIPNCRQATVRRKEEKKSDNNKLLPGDRPAHDWYRFVLSFPPHLVRRYLHRFGVEPGQRVLDPFCGTGTTLVECQKHAIVSVGMEANPMAHFASQVKTNWDPDPDGLLEHAHKIARIATAKLEAGGIEDNPVFLSMPKTDLNLRGLDSSTQKLLLEKSISPVPLHKTLVLLESLHEQCDKRFDSHERLALAKALVFGISNLHFGPEVGIGPSKPDAPVIARWLESVEIMAQDLRALGKMEYSQAQAYLADSRKIPSVLRPHSVDAVITSPPYPNEKDYTRTTRLESVLLGFIRDSQDLRALKKTLVRSNTRSVYTTDDDDHWVLKHRRIQEIADAIEARRIELGKTSGFERLYARVTKLYFGGMAKHLAELRSVLRPGSRLAYVVGDQASYLRVMIRTGELLAEIAQSLGYEVTNIDLFRTRLSTTTKEQLREEVVVLRWPGGEAP